MSTIKDNDLQVIVISIEHKGDGSNNYVDYYRPIPHIYLDKEIAAKALFDFMKKDQYYKEFLQDSLCDSDSDCESQTSEPEVDNTLSPIELLDKGLRRGGFEPEINEGNHIRITTLPIDSTKSIKQEYNYWELPKVPKFADENKESELLRKAREYATRRGIKIAEDEVKIKKRLR